MQAILTSCRVEMSFPSTVDFALWEGVILRLLKAAADETYDPSWDDNLEPGRVSLPGSGMALGVLWSPGSGSGPFDVDYKAARDNIQNQLQYLSEQRENLVAARNDKIEAIKREATELHSIRAVLAGLMEATAQQAVMLESKKMKYRNIVEMLDKDPSEEDKALQSKAKEILDIWERRHSQRETTGSAVRRVVEALDQRVKDLEQVKQDSQLSPLRASNVEGPDN
jgi:hypothetical protein